MGKKEEQADRDVMILHSVTPDGEAINALRSRQGRLDMTELRPLKDGQDVSHSEVVKLKPHKDMPIVCDVDVLYSPEESRVTLDSLKSMWIDVPGRGKVPFEVVGEALERNGVSVINRYNRRRVVNVQADVDKNRIEPGLVNREIIEVLLPDILAKYPGVTQRLSGQAENRSVLSGYR